MRLKLGQKVCLSSDPNMRYPAIIIAIDADDVCLLGWESEQEANPVAWEFKCKEKDIPVSCTILEDVSLRRIRYSYWAYHNQILLMKKYSRVSHKTLRKRVRDQIAQQVFTGKS